MTYRLHGQITSELVDRFKALRRVQLLKFYFSHYRLIGVVLARNEPSCIKTVYWKHISHE